MLVYTRLRINHQYHFILGAQAHATFQHIPHSYHVAYTPASCWDHPHPQCLHASRLQARLNPLSRAQFPAHSGAVIRDSDHRAPDIQSL